MTLSNIRNISQEQQNFEQVAHMDEERQTSAHKEQTIHQLELQSEEQTSTRKNGTTSIGSFDLCSTHGNNINQGTVISNENNELNARNTETSRFVRNDSTMNMIKNVNAQTNNQHSKSSYKHIGSMGSTSKSITSISTGSIKHLTDYESKRDNSFDASYEASCEFLSPTTLYRVRYHDIFEVWVDGSKLRKERDPGNEDFIIMDYPRIDLVRSIHSALDETKAVLNAKKSKPFSTHMRQTACIIDAKIQEVLPTKSNSSTLAIQFYEKVTNHSKSQKESIAMGPTCMNACQGEIQQHLDSDNEYKRLIAIARLNWDTVPLKKDKEFSSKSKKHIEFVLTEKHKAKGLCKTVQQHLKTQQHRRYIRKFMALFDTILDVHVNEISKMYSRLNKNQSRESRNTTSENGPDDQLPMADETDLTCGDWLIIVCCCPIVACQYLLVPFEILGWVLVAIVS